MRVLVTGSRDWDDPDSIYNELEWIRQQQGDFTLVEGGCPTGADRIAADAFRASGMGHMVETWEADWRKHGKRAGYLRNQAMIDSRPDKVLAFIRNDSRGASMTARMARTAGIELTVVTRAS